MEGGETGHGSGDAQDRLDRMRRENLARLLVRAFDMMEAEVLERMAEEGIRLKRTWLPVLRNVELAGSRITEIADASGLAKQTVGPLVQELTEEGILRVDPDPEDGRAKLVRYTEAGAEGCGRGSRCSSPWSGATRRRSDRSATSSYGGRSSTS